MWHSRKYFPNPCWKTARNDTIRYINRSQTSAWIVVLKKLRQCLPAASDANHDTAVEKANQVHLAFLTKLQVHNDPHETSAQRDEVKPSQLAYINLALIVCNLLCFHYFYQNGTGTFVSLQAFVWCATCPSFAEKYFWPNLVLIIISFWVKLQLDFRGLLIRYLGHHP